MTTQPDNPAETRSGSPALRLLRPFVYVTLFSLIVRALWVANAQVTPIGDHYGYDRSAVHWLATGAYRSRISDLEYRVGTQTSHERADLAPNVRAYRTPGYIMFVAGLYALFGHNWAVVGAAQALLGALTSGLLVVLAGRMVSVRAGVTAGLLHALWPTSLAFVPVIASDNLAVFLLIAGLTCLVFSHRRRGWWSGVLACLAGVIYGGMFLARPVSLFFLPAWLLLAWYDPPTRQRRPRALILCLAGAAVVMAPWFIRNAALGYGVTTISTQGGYALWWGNNWRSIDGGNPAPPRFRGDRELSEIEQHRFFRQKAVEWIGSNPRRYLALSAVRLARLLGTQYDVWAAKYFFPTAENDRLICAVYWPDRYPPEVVAAGREFELRNRLWHQRFRVVAAPVMLLGVLLALRRARTFAYALLPLACYVLGLALTVFAGRYRVTADALMFITLGALLADLLFGSRDIGWWGGRWTKLALVAGAVGFSVVTYATGMDRNWYRLPAGCEPNPPIEHLGPYRVTLDLDAERGVRSIASSTCEVALNTTPVGLDCELAGSADTSDHQYGGVRIPLRGMAAASLDITWRKPENIDAIFVIGRGASADPDAESGRRDILRWEWHRLGAETIPPAKRQTYVLAPGERAAYFVPRNGQDADDELLSEVALVDELRLLVRLKPTTGAGFTLHNLTIVVPPSPNAAPATGEQVTLTAQQMEPRPRPFSNSGCHLRSRFVDDGLRCDLQGTPGTEGYQYGGVRFNVPNPTTFELAVSFTQPENIQAIFLVGHDVEGRRSARWEWPVASLGVHPSADQVGRYAFTIGESSDYFTWLAPEATTLAELRFIVRLVPGTSSGFTLHEVTLGSPSELAGPDGS